MLLVIAPPLRTGRRQLIFRLTTGRRLRSAALGPRWPGARRRIAPAGSVPPARTAASWAHRCPSKAYWTIATAGNLPAGSPGRRTRFGVGLSGRNLTHRVGPLGQDQVLRVLLLQLVDVTQQVGPAPLVRPLVHVVGSVEVATNTPSNSSPNTSSNRPAPAGPVEEVAHLWRAETPEIPITAILTPARFAYTNRAGNLLA